jgi:PhzF family phenazine biosynthesis protein
VPAESTALGQECGAGVLQLTVEGSGPDRRIFVRAPEAKIIAEHWDAAGVVGEALGAKLPTQPAPMAIDVGPVWLVAYTDDEDSISSLRPDMAAVADLSREMGVIGVTVFAIRAAGDEKVHLRTFAPLAGIQEDPVCGSCNVALAAYLSTTGLIAETGDEYIASQGRELGRDGRVYVRVREGGRHIEIGGHAVTTIDGEISV